MPRLSVLIGTQNRHELLKRCLSGLANQTFRDVEIVVLDDGSENPVDEDVLAVYTGGLPVRCLLAEHPMGIAKGRNFLMINASGNLLCVLDDDAYFEDPHALHRIVHTFEKRPEVGILAFKIIDYRYGLIRLLTPHSQHHLRKEAGVTDARHYASYFLGGGHAIRKEVFLRCQGYSPHFFYGHEELDLSFKALEAGFRIFYEPTIQAHHQPVPQKGATQHGAKQRERLFFHIRNRLFLAYQHLPMPYLIVHVGVWLARYGVRALSQGALLTYFKAMWAGLTGLDNVTRTPIRKSTIGYLKAHFGRLWY